MGGDYRAAMRSIFGALDWVGGSEQVVIEEPWNIDGVRVVDSWPLH